MRSIPKVSVIVPNYNHAPYLRERLDSVYDQTFNDFEVILLDDASTDDSISILTEYAKRPNTRLIVNKVNSGSPFKQWNRGIGLARGEFVWIAESDDRCQVEFIAESVQELVESPQKGLSFCASRTIDASGEYIKDGLLDIDTILRKLDRDNFKLSLLQELVVRNCIVNASSVIFRRSSYLECSGVMDGLAFAGDWVLWVNIINSTDVVYVCKTLNEYRIHDSTQTKRPELLMKRSVEQYMALEKIFKIVNPRWIIRQKSFGFAFHKLFHDNNLAWIDSASRKKIMKVAGGDSFRWLRFLKNNLLEHISLHCKCFACLS